jgi:hypothetical protein
MVVSEAKAHARRLAFGNKDQSSLGWAARAIAVIRAVAAPIPMHTEQAWRPSSPSIRQAATCQSVLLAQRNPANTKRPTAASLLRLAARREPKTLLRDHAPPRRPREPVMLTFAQSEQPAWTSR